MISALERFDPRTAAGLLARTALSLEDYGNPAARAQVENEEQIRKAILGEAMRKLGLSEVAPQELSGDAIQRVADYIDDQTDAIAGAPDTREAFSRLISSGDFPSDLYKIQIDANLKRQLGKLFDRESILIERTVRAPMEEQHFGPPKSPKEPFLISLFARRFRTGYPYKDFTLLVGGQRGDGENLRVVQAFRLYESQIGKISSDLVQALKRFADVYGADVKLGDKTGHFFLTAPMEPTLNFHVDLPERSRKLVHITHYGQTDPVSKNIHSALVVAIDLNEYLDTVRKLDAELID